MEVVVESKRARGIDWMDLKYFEFVETMPDGQRNIIKVDEKRIVVNMQDGIIYPQITTPINREGLIEWKIVDVVTHDEALLFTDKDISQ